MSDYNYLTYSQEQLNRAIELLKDNPLAIEEAIDALKILATTKPIYKKAYGTDEFVQVGKLTAKNEIIFAEPRPSGFDKPKTHLYPSDKNLARVSNVYWTGWFVFNEDKREEHLSYYEISNRNQFQEILYYQSKRDEVETCYSPVLGFMMGDSRTAEVVFYDQYIGE